jgi:hypothetical protein
MVQLKKEWENLLHNFFTFDGSVMKMFFIAAGGRNALAYLAWFSVTRKNKYDIDTWCQGYQPSSLFGLVILDEYESCDTDKRRQCYKTCYGRNLRVIISWGGCTFLRSADVKPTSNECMPCHGSACLLSTSILPRNLLFDWFGISSMTTDNFCVYLPDILIQTSQTGRQW